MTGTTEQTNQIESQRLVSSIVELGYNSYLKGKEVAVNTRYISSVTRPSLNLLEKGASTVTAISPVKPETVLTSLDQTCAGCINYGSEKTEAIKASLEATKTYGTEKTEAIKTYSTEKTEAIKNYSTEKTEAIKNYSTEKTEAIKAGIEATKKKPAEISQATVVYLHDKLSSLKKEEKSVSPDDIGVGALVGDVGDIVYEQADALSQTKVVKAVTGKVSPIVDTVLTTSESVVDRILAPAEDEEKRDTSTVAPVRAFNLSKTATKRVRNNVVTSYNNIRKRTTNLVHIDLVKYDRAALNGKVTTYVNVCKVSVEKRIVEPTKNMAAVTSQRVSDAGAVAKMYRDAATNRVVESVSATSDKVYKVTIQFIPVQVSDMASKAKIMAGETYTDYVYLPSEQIALAFKAEVEKLQQKHENKKLTPLDGLHALFLTVRARVSQEYDQRVAPVVSKLTGRKKVEEEAEEKEQVVVEKEQDNVTLEEEEEEVAEEEVEEEEPAADVSASDASSEEDDVVPLVEENLEEELE